MPDLNFLGIFDIVLLVFGCYVIFAGVRMKKTGKISNLILNETEAAKISDKQGYIETIFPKMMVFAGVIAAYGLLAMLDDLKVVEIPMVQLIGMGVFIVVMIWFFRALIKARAKYQGL